MKIVRTGITVIARILISLVFLCGAMNQILYWHDAERNLMSVLSEWQLYSAFSDQLQQFFVSTIPWTSVLLIVGTIVELLGGLSFLLGVKQKWGATILILFLIPTTLLMHPFWFIEGNAKEVQMTHFLKNLAIIGGLLFVLLQPRSNPTSQRLG